MEASPTCLPPASPSLVPSMAHPTSDLRPHSRLDGLDWPGPSRFFFLGFPFPIPPLLSVSALRRVRTRDAGSKLLFVCFIAFILPEHAGLPKVGCFPAPPDLLTWPRAAQRRTHSGISSCKPLAAGRLLVLSPTERVRKRASNRSGEVGSVLFLATAHCTPGTSRRPPLATRGCARP